MFKHLWNTTAYYDQLEFVFVLVGRDRGQRVKYKNYIDTENKKRKNKVKTSLFRIPYHRKIKISCTNLRIHHW